MNDGPCSCPCSRGCAGAACVPWGPASWTCSPCCLCWWVGGWVGELLHTDVRPPPLSNQKINGRLPFPSQPNPTQPTHPTQHHSHIKHETYLAMPSTPSSTGFSSMYWSASFMRFLMVSLSALLTGKATTRSNATRASTARGNAIFCFFLELAVRVWRGGWG